VVLAACGACHKAEQDRQTESSTGSRQGTLTTNSITGTVRYIDVEGGFYGIEADDGTKLDPVNLPVEFQQDGVRIRVQVEPLKNRVSLRMWGRLVRIVSLERL
jgi:hypothetical protein